MSKKRSNIWTSSEVQYIRENYGTLTATEIAQNLTARGRNRRSQHSVRKQAALHGISRPRTSAKAKPTVKLPQSFADKRADDRIVIEESRRPHCAATVVGDYRPKELSYRGQSSALES